MPGMAMSRIRHLVCVDAIGREELFRRRERLDRKAELLQQVGQRLAHGLVVIDDRYKWACMPSRIPHHGAAHPSQQASETVAKIADGVCTHHGCRRNRK